MKFLASILSGVILKNVALNQTLYLSVIGCFGSVNRFLIYLYGLLDTEMSVT